MPIFAPRQEPVKKREELLKREHELLQAINKNIPGEQLHISVEKYRKAQLSLLKARMHAIKEKEYQNRLTDYRPGKVISDIEAWENKTVDNIIDEFKQQHAIF